MQNKTIYKKEITRGDSEIAFIIDNNEDVNESLIMELKNGDKIHLESCHEPDCCEHVFADFSAIKYYMDYLTGKNLDEIILKEVPAMGFLLCLVHDDLGSYPEDVTKIFIPCYNHQNGYYSDELGIKFTYMINGDNGPEVSEDLVSVNDCVPEHEE